MAKVVIDARIINSSTGRYVERLLTYLEKIDTTNTYTVLVPQKDIGYWRPSNPNFSLVVSNYKNYSVAEQLGFALQLYRLKADLVHFCMPQQPLLYLKPHLTTIHDLTLLKTYNSDKNWLVYHFKQVIGRGLFWCVARLSRHILTPSLYTKQEFVRFAKINQSKVTVTYEAADTPTDAPKKIALPHQQFILYVGQQSDYKNIRRLILTHQKLLEKYPQLGLVLVGGKNKSAITNEQWVKKKGYKNVHFTGFVSDQELTWLYQHTHAYVFPSLREGFGLPGLEAMAQGAPVVSSNATCLPEIYGDAAHYYDPLNVDDMVQKITQVLGDKELRTKLIGRGRERVKRYSWATMAEQTHAVYVDILKRRK